MKKPKICIMNSYHEEWNKLGVEVCSLCKNKIGKSFRERLNDKVRAVPRALKQEYLNKLHEGLNIGQAITAVDPEEKYESIVWHQILSENIEFKGYSFLKKEAV